MPFTFKLDKPRDMQATFERLKARLATTGGLLTGNEEEGFISVEGVEGRYVVEENAIKVTITKKPVAIIPNRLIEKEIRGVFREMYG